MDKNAAFPCDKDFKYSFFSGTGKGGQHRNRHQNCVRAIHVPTGITETCQSHRERHRNIGEARTALILRLRNENEARERNRRNEKAKSQTGRGESGDKIKTYVFKHDLCRNHVTGKSATTTQILNGELWRLWN